MTTPTDMIKDLSAIDMTRLAMEIFNSPDVEKEALWLLRDQWEQGKDKDGDPIGYYKSDYYARKKNSMNSRAGLGIIDLMLTHALEEGLFVSISGDEFEFQSTDGKFADLKDRYPQAWNLTEDAKGELRQIFSDLLIKKITELTGMQ